MQESDRGSAPAPKAKRRRPKLVLQRDTEDCGAAALATICGYYGTEPGLCYLRKLAQVGLDGTSFYAISRAAQTLGLSSCGVEAAFSELYKLRLPAMASLDRHFVVVHRADQEEVVIGDPAVGWRTLKREDFCRHWDGVLLQFEATPQFHQVRLPQRSPWTLLHMLSNRLKLRLASVVLLTLVLNGVVLLLPILTQIIVDRLLRLEPSQDVGMLVIAAFCMLAFTSAIEGFRYYVVHRVSLDVQMQVGILLARHLFRLPLKHFLSRASGDSISRVDEARQLGSFLGSQGAEAIVDLLLVLLGLVVVCYYSWVLGLAFFLVGVTLLVSSFVVGSKVYRHALRAVQLQAQGLTIFMEGIRRIALLKSHNASEAWAMRWYKKNSSAGSEVIRSQDLSSVLAVVSQGLLRVTPLAVAWVGLGGNGSLSVGAVIAVTTVMMISLSALLKLSGHYLEAQRTLLGIERILDIFEETPEEVSRVSLAQKARGRSAPGKPGVSVRNLTFSYIRDGRSPVINDVCMTIPQGTTAAIVGPSGSGKTTLAYLLAGLLSPDSGTISLGSHEMRELALDEVRRRVALVPQESSLIRGTIVDNVTLGSDDVDTQRVIQALRLSQSEEFVFSDPQGLERLINEDGIGLSAGQRQRLSIARALYRGPEFLILDEPTSNLDIESECALMMEFGQLRGTLTTLIIAHRLQTVREADHLFVIDGGKVVEAGAPGDLKQQGGRYHEMLKAGRSLS